MVKKLLEIVLEKKHYQYRKECPVEFAGEFFAQKLSPIERMTRRFERMCELGTPMIPGITDTEENLTEIEKIIGESPWEKLPYNAIAGAKYEMLGMEYAIRNIT